MYGILNSPETPVHFKYTIEMDLDLRSCTYGLRARKWPGGSTDIDKLVIMHP